MSSHSQEMNEGVVVQELVGLTDKEQTEQIAEQLSKVFNLYSPLKNEDINIKDIYDKRPLPEFRPYVVYQKIMSTKNKILTVIGDVHMKLITFCAEELSQSGNKREYPDIYKMEIVTPAPKVYPPQKTSDLRKISGTLSFSKIFEKIIAEVMLEDMKPSRDPSQYGTKYRCLYPTLVNTKY